MKLTIKAKPEDFIVHEIASLPLSDKGEYGAYTLTKQGWNTVELLGEISRTLHIPLSLFSYGGRKDRHGLTTQYITIKHPKPLSLRKINYSLECIGRMACPMGPALIQANTFRITVRNLDTHALHSAASQLKLVAAFGYPNYFDDQRFGSYDPAQGFFAEKVLKKQFNGALKTYLASIYPQDDKETRKKKQFFIEHWKQWQECASQACIGFEQKTFACLTRKPYDFLGALSLISKEELSLRYASYQSYLWNQMLTSLICAHSGGSALRYPGSCGPYVFYAGLPPEKQTQLHHIALPTPGSKPDLTAPIARQLYTQTLESHGIKNAMFNSLRLRKAFFKSFLRQALVTPQELFWKYDDDELYKGRKKLLLKYTLPRGSFATMLLKRIFSPTPAASAPQEQ